MGKEGGKTMHPFIQPKSATPLLVVASAIFFVCNIASASTPEETSPNVIDDALTTPRAVVADFNGDGHPDYVLGNPSTRQTAIWFLNNNVFIGSAFGPTIPASWNLEGAADFNQDLHPDYALFQPQLQSNSDLVSIRADVDRNRFWANPSQ
jgi:hypothetical protein